MVSKKIYFTYNLQPTTYNYLYYARLDKEEEGEDNLPNFIINRFIFMTKAKETQSNEYHHPLIGISLSKNGKTYCILDLDLGAHVKPISGQNVWDGVVFFQEIDSQSGNLVGHKLYGTVSAYANSREVLAGFLKNGYELISDVSKILEDEGEFELDYGKGILSQYNASRVLIIK